MPSVATTIEFPKPLLDLLGNSSLYAPVRALVDRAGQIFSDNKLYFFPDYTDHGIEHINGVLQSEVSLVPEQVWNHSPALLTDVDAAVIIGATILHDIAMHLYPEGFLELIGPDSRFQPLTWFRENQDGHFADRPWHELWSDYQQEARRFNDQSLANIAGIEAVRSGWKFKELSKNQGEWDSYTLRVIGEFIRRHHARLAHEIAIYGFPGLISGSNEPEFPALGKKGHPLEKLADLIGLTARSHGTSLRVCNAYLEDDPRYSGMHKPMGAAVLYPMALLRVADFLQISSQRTPAVLLQLRKPQSPVSVQNWKMHEAVQHIGPAKNPYGVMVTVSNEVSLEVYLLLQELIERLQAEIDHATVVLDEAYGLASKSGLNQLNLAIRRVYSNLHNPNFQNQLDYVPERTGFSSDPHLLTLLTEPLYGKYPSIGVRELMQNSVDAVRELKAWCDSHNVAISSLDLPDQTADVLIDFIKTDRWTLRIRDKGIGMSSDTIQRYFLRAGASFRQSPDWNKDFAGADGKSRVLRSGRFGIGAFSIFLLGSSFRLKTRHAGAESSMGYALEASIESQLIEIRKEVGLPVGTTIEVELNLESMQLIENCSLSCFEGLTDWFCWAWPNVTRRIIDKSENSSRTKSLFGKEPERQLSNYYSIPLGTPNPPPEWSVIHPKGFDAVYWTFTNVPALVCNGIRIMRPLESGPSSIRELFEWPQEVQFRRPNIAVLDNDANLPLTIQRNGLSCKDLPFINELARDITLSFLAYSLVLGPSSSGEAHAKAKKSSFVFPLALGNFSNDLNFEKGQLRWCTTNLSMVPADPWLYSLLAVDRCFVYGTYHESETDSELILKETITDIPHAIIRWDYAYRLNNDSPSNLFPYGIYEMLNNLAYSGVSAVGHKVNGSAIGLFQIGSFTSDVDDYYMSKMLPPRTASTHKTLNWRCVKSSSAERLLQTEVGDIKPSIDLEDNPFLLKSSERHFSACSFVAEIWTEPVVRTPKSLIAKIWNECLGPVPIPFDPSARQALIEHGMKHAELKRHILAWQKKKPTGSN